MNKKTGGPAFPTSDWDENGRAYKMHGATLRDYFAVKAMQSMNIRQDYIDAPADAIALDAYALADAMLKAREA